MNEVERILLEWIVAIGIILVATMALTWVMDNWYNWRNRK